MNELEIVLKIVLSGIGGILLIVGIAFIFPYRAISKLSAVVKGVIKDITNDAYRYNQRITSKFEKGKKVENPPKSGVRFSAGVGGRSNFDGKSKQMYHVIYSYTIDGVEYSRADGPGYTKEIVKKRIGSEVIVHYDPQNPLNASLSTGMVYKILSCSFIPVGIVLVILGFIF